MTFLNLLEMQLALVTEKKKQYQVHLSFNLYLGLLLKDINHSKLTLQILLVQW